MKEAVPDLGECVSRFPALARFRLELEALDPISLPEYPGSAWRGLLGHGLRRSACVTGQPTCAGCLLTQSCVYSVLFETPPPPDKDLVGFTAMPHPFVLDIDPRAPANYEAGDRIELGFTLIGAVASQAPYLIHALGSAGRQGIGRSRGRFRVDVVQQEEGAGTDLWEPVYEASNGTYRQRPTMPPRPPPAPGGVRLRMRTPLRMKRDGHFIVPERFAIADLLRHLYNRLHRQDRKDSDLVKLPSVPDQPRNSAAAPRALARLRSCLRFGAPFRPLLQLYRTPLGCPLSNPPSVASRGPCSSSALSIPLRRRDKTSLLGGSAGVTRQACRTSAAVPFAAFCRPSRRCQGADRQGGRDAPARDFKGK